MIYLFFCLLKWNAVSNFTMLTELTNKTEKKDGKSLVFILSIEDSGKKRKKKSKNDFTAE